MTGDDMPELAHLMARVIVHGEPPESVAGDVTAFRKRFDALKFIR